MSLFSDPVGNFPFESALDTAVWIHSGQFPGGDLQCLQDTSEMGGLFPDHFLTKDEDGSTTSDMNDSAYMSQPDTGRRGAASYAEGAMQMPAQEFKAQSGQFLYPNSLFSPALSSVSSNMFQGSSEMNHFALPPASDSDSNRSMMADFGMNAFNRVPDFNFTATPQGGWPSTDAQTFSGPFAVSPIEAPNFMFQHPSSMPQTYQPEDFVRNDSGSRHNSVQHRSQSMHLTPNTTLEPTRVSTPSSAGTVEHSRFFSQTQSLQNGNPTLISPASSALNQEGYSASNGYFNYQSSGDLSDLQETARPTESSERYEETGEDSIDPSGDSTTALEESESTKLARTHALYQATPQDDDLYHCPHEGEAGCGHKPTKLKCNYDKYVDSHLRPFRCKVSACLNTPFSSTACLLRHEREAHGMHGHGSKPHLCVFPDCERSNPGNGFPRRYNLFDHMKRVHDYNGDMPSVGEEGPNSSSSTSIKRAGGRKRKSTGPPEDAPEKRQKVTKPSAAEIMHAEQRSRQEKEKKLQEQFDQQRGNVLELFNNIEGPFDHVGYEKFMKAADSLKDIMRQANMQGSG